MAKLKQSPPWVTYAHEATEMFRYDPEVHVVYDNEEYKLTLYVDNGAKAAALSQLLPTEQEFGNITLEINVVPANGLATAPTKPIDLFQTAFKGNGAFSFAKRVHGVFVNDLTYVVFRNRVVQYFDDNLGDIYGHCSTLYENIARNLFGVNEGVFFCTDVEQHVGECAPANVSSPLGEWP